MKHVDHLAAMGIETWQARQADAVAADRTTTVAISAVDTNPVADVSPAKAGISLESTSNEEDPRFRGDDVEKSGDDTGNVWHALQKQAETCQQCVLAQTRTQVVFGIGSQQADVLIVGEAPGVSEDMQGEPFVGRAGQLLNNMLSSIGLQREQVYIANVLKCRPPNNRDPKPEEVASCTPFLEQQIQLLQPKIILALGRTAAHFLLGRTEDLASMRGREYCYHNTPLLVSYHPAYLLRSPKEKRKSMQDLQALQKYLA